MDAKTRFSTQIVGGLPLIAAYLEELEIGRIVNEVVPWEGDVRLGTLVEVLILNRLLHPQGLYSIGTWATGASVTDYYELTAEQLNDDRLGRALERLEKYGPAVQVPLVLGVIKKFRLRVTQVHYDISNAELYGAYQRQLARFKAVENAKASLSGARPPQPAYGHTKSGRKNMKQIQFGLNIVRDGAVPVGLLPLDGNAAEAPTHLENLRLLDFILPKGKRLYMADSKADTPETLLTIKASDGEFVCTGVLSPQLKQEYLRLKGELKDVDYYPKSQAHLPPEERDQYKVAERPQKLEGYVDGRLVRLKYRVIFAWSEAKARQQAQTRERHLAKIREEFEAVERNLNKYTLKTEEQIVRRLESARSKYVAGALFGYELKTAKGQFRLKWWIDKKAQNEQEALDGAYVLKTNLPKGVYSAGQVLKEYKEQIHIERRFGDLKGPLAVTPMFLEKPERIGGLLYILVWALMVMALMERAVRRNLKGKPMYGIYPENRPSPAPTGRAILKCFADLCIVIMKRRGEIHRRLSELSPVQQKLVKLLDLPPNSLRGFKRQCTDSG